MYYGSETYHQKIRWYLTFERLASRISEMKFKVFLSLESGNANIGSYICWRTYILIFVTTLQQTILE